MSGGTPAGTSAASSASPELEEIVRFYLDSGDFNGYPLTAVLPSAWNAKVLSRLVSEGLVQVVTDADYPNPHIRPWASKRSIADQGGDLNAALQGSGSCCLYPTPSAMQGRPLSVYDQRPYTKRVAEGTGVLELVYFDMAAIEQYRNDPRYHFTPDDFGFSFGIGDDAYLNADEPEHDKIHTVRAGFGFDLDQIQAGRQDVRRYACAFYLDLAKMTPKHQQRLLTYEVEPGNLKPHPVWMSMQMGHWAEHIGPFEKILGELQALNELWTICFGQDLFRTTDRPRGWGWILRPSTNEWEAFIHTTDKLLSDNLIAAALDAANAPTHNDSGQPLGTLGRFEAMFLKRSTADPAAIRRVFQPLRDVRKQRQKPAHDNSDHVTDTTIYGKQRQTLNDVADSLDAIRHHLSTHPKAKQAGWAAEEYLDDWLVL